MTSPFDPDEIVIDGITSFAELAQDTSFVKLGARQYAQVKESVRPLIKVGDSCSVAFPTMIIRPDLRAACFVTVLQDRVVVAWQKGLLRSKVFTQTLLGSAITDVTWQVSAAPPTKGAVLLTITAEEPVVVAMPQGSRDVANAVRDAVAEVRPR